MRVAHVTTTGRIGGAERLIQDIAPGLRDAGWKATVYVLRDPDELRGALGGAGVEVRSLGVMSPQDGLGGLLRLARELRQEVDLVHGHLTHGALAATIAGRVARLPVVVTRHHAGLVHSYGGPVRRLMERVGMRWADRVVAISKAVGCAAVRSGARRDGLVMIPNGVDLDRLQRSCEAPAPPPFRVAALGSLNPAKGHEYLIDAVAILVSRGRDVELVVIGDGPLRPLLEQRASSLGLGAKVRWCGHVTDPQRLLSECHALVQPSLEEGFGIAVLEAMALSLPVVATRVGGLVDVIDDGVTGLLVLPRQPSALAAAIERLDREPALAERLGRAGRERVRARFDARAIAAAYARVYESLVARNA